MCKITFQYSKYIITIIAFKTYNLRKNEFHQKLCVILLCNLFRADFMQRFLCFGSYHKKSCCYQPSKEELFPNFPCRKRKMDNLDLVLFSKPKYFLGKWIFLKIFSTQNYKLTFFAIFLGSYFFLYFTKTFISIIQLK